MKTGKLLVIILIIVLLAVYYLLGTDYHQQRQRHEALASQITVAVQALSQIPEPPADLETRLAAAQASLEYAKDSFPGGMNSNQIVNAILKDADEYGVKAIPLITQPWTAEDFGDHKYAAFRLNIAATGTFDQLADFVNELERGGFKTLIVEDLSVAREDGPAGAESTTRVSASLGLAIFTRFPTSD